MNLGTKQVSSKSLSEKFPRVVISLKRDPYVVIVCRPTKDADAEAMVLSPMLFNLLNNKAETCDVLTRSPEFTELRMENDRLRRQLQVTLEKLGGLKLGEEVWKELRGSLLDAIRIKSELWPEVEPDPIEVIGGA